MTQKVDERYKCEDCGQAFENEKVLKTHEEQEDCSQEGNQYRWENIQDAQNDKESKNMNSKVKNEKVGNDKDKLKGDKDIQPVQKTPRVDRENKSPNQTNSVHPQEGEPRKSNLDPIGRDAQDDEKWQREVETSQKEKNRCSCGESFSSNEELEAHETICTDEKNRNKSETTLPQEGQGF